MDRSKTVLLVKNISFSTTKDELHELFARYGLVKSVLLSPSNTLAIITYNAAGRAKTAVEKLCNVYHRGLPLYIEYAPLGFAPDESNAEQ